MKFSEYQWNGRTTKQQATNYANALKKNNYSAEYINAQLCCIQNLSINDIKEITS